LDSPWRSARPFAFASRPNCAASRNLSWHVGWAKRSAAQHRGLRTRGLCGDRLRSAQPTQALRADICSQSNNHALPLPLPFPFPCRLRLRSRFCGQEARALPGAPGERREAVESPVGSPAGMPARFVTVQGCTVHEPRPPHANPERMDARRARTRGGLLFGYFLLATQEKVTRVARRADRKLWLSLSLSPQQPQPLQQLQPRICQSRAPLVAKGWSPRSAPPSPQPLSHGERGSNRAPIRASGAKPL
jgi:hypothetical protein